jgi:hypothetical protein
MPASREAANIEKNGDDVEQAHSAPIAVELDDFGLPVKKRKLPIPVEVEESADKDGNASNAPAPEEKEASGPAGRKALESIGTLDVRTQHEDGDSSSEEEEFKDARSTPVPTTPIPDLAVQENIQTVEPTSNFGTQTPKEAIRDVDSQRDEAQPQPPNPSKPVSKAPESFKPDTNGDAHGQDHDVIVEADAKAPELPKSDKKEISNSQNHSGVATPNGHIRGKSSTGQGISEYSHQHALQEAEIPAQEEDEWQTMPAYAPFDMYDDDNKLIAREEHESDVEADAYAGLGGAGKGYTRVQLDEDAQSATSLDENTQYLFKDINGGTGAGEMEDEEQRDAVTQMQATKDLLTEGQRIAYVGMTRLILSLMINQAESIATTKGTKKELHMAAEAMQMWSQKMMVRLYAHMEISTAEQIMIEQLAEHGVQPSDLTPTLMQNARVKNPMAEKAESVASSERSPRPSVSSASVSSPRLPQTPQLQVEELVAAPPPYQEHEGDDLPEVRTPSQLPTTANLDIDLRWTVLCDLFLTLVADSVYDARSRVLLEKIGENMDVSWLEICRFEKRVTDALEMQQAAEKENWNEDEHKENRRKMALKKRYLMMGLATVGGSLVIGLSAGLLAPVIGAGLAAGFTTIGVAGTSGFLAGAGGAAIITSGAAASGGVIAVRAANRRTGAVKTFEYRPLHNNKRVNLIVTVSGWMTGKVDDVRLPYSTVDPIMGDIYSVLWEPEMLTSMGDTINILATEVKPRQLSWFCTVLTFVGSNPRPSTSPW